ncbi:MAG: hypothetical protein HKN42_17320 [Granulosicoccus sp.]|nr:hypothetical protein [Granulosicoccus sp.]
MPSIHVQTSIDIDAPADRIREVLVDFHTWPAWSPWLYIEPEAQVSYRGDVGQPGHGYDWTGQKVGAGGMTLTRQSNERIDCDLQFLKPFKSSAKVQFDLQAGSQSRTAVTWHMDSSLPFFLFFMEASMSAMIRSDFRRGLLLLKDYVEQGATHSHSEVQGVVKVDAVDYVGCAAETAMSDLSGSMQETFTALHDGLRQADIQSVGLPFCLYEKMNIKRDHCRYTVAMPVAAAVPAPAPLLVARRAECMALKVVHTGPYHHLGNAWALLMSEARHRKLKVHRNAAPFECYLDDPQNTDAQELVTELFLPVRG